MSSEAIFPTALPSDPAARGCQVLYLGISGVLHPSESLYKLLNKRSPWDDGHSKFECVQSLEEALQGWPDVRIVLTSTFPWRYGLDLTLEKLGGPIASRVLSFTFEDLTTKATRAVRNISTGATRVVGYSVDDYWRMNKSHIVLSHIEWAEPAAWVAVDDEDILWPLDVRENNLVLTDGCEGLRSPAAMDRLLTAMLGNFAR